MPQNHAGGRRRISGGARDSRAVSGDPPETPHGVREGTHDLQIFALFTFTSASVVRGESPQTARESRAPPGSCCPLPVRSELREPLAIHARAAARAFREFRAGVIAKLECAEVALHEIAQGERLATMATDIVQHGGEQHDGEAEARIDEEHFVKFEAKHAVTSEWRAR